MIHNFFFSRDIFKNKITKMVKYFVLISVVLFCVCVTEQAYFLQEDFINKINEEVTTWTAGFNFDPSTPKEHILSRLGSKGVQNINTIDMDTYKTSDKMYSFHYIPRKFDARRRWRHCKRIGEVRDQGNCGNSWAVSTTSAFADRFCIATKGKFNKQFSMEMVTSCCEWSGFGCNGGWPIGAWSYFFWNGVVTGGDYNTTEGCQPYQTPPCSYDRHGVNTCVGKPMEPPHECDDTCFGNKSIKYQNDIHKTRDYYSLTYPVIQKDLMLYGPLEASFHLYDDFLNYKSGVYVKSNDAKYLGGHSVKLIGWGEENGVKYWLMVNSWNRNWGDNGLFKIRRGTNECNVDISMTAGIPNPTLNPDY